MTEQRVEKHKICQNDKYYLLLDEFCFMSKNLYNHANYIIRHEFIENNKWVRYQELGKILKQDKDYPDYANMPTTQSAQQTLRLLDKNWKSFFTSIKDYAKNKDKYLGRPKLPKYRKKDGREILILTNQNAKLKDEDGLIHFPKAFKGMTIKPKFTEKKNFTSFQQVRFLPGKKHIVVELVYKVKIPEQKQENNKKYIGIDIGVDNLATICNTFGETPIIINVRLVP